MDFMSSLLVFVSIWLVVLFMALPIGIKPSIDSDKGCDSGAPDKPRLGLKFIWTTGITLLIWGSVYLLSLIYKDINLNLI